MTTVAASASGPATEVELFLTIEGVRQTEVWR